MKRIISSIIFWMVLIVITPLVLGASWSGYVLDESGSGISTVNVNAVLTSNENFVNATSTDSSGAFVIEIPDSTSVRLVSSKSGFVADTSTSLPPVTSDFALPFNITLLQAIPGSIIGTVTNSGASSIVNAVVSAVQGGSTIKSTTTDSGGGYTLASLTDGTYVMRVEAITYLFQELTNVIVLSNSTTNVDFILASAPSAPVISNIKVGSITNTSATITYTTNELANSSVSYGTTTSLGLTESSIFFVISHSINLSNLSRNTLYYFNVTSCDSTNDCSTEGPFSFTTLSDFVSEGEEGVEGVGGVNCIYLWNCTDWQPLICPESGEHTRTCTNEGTCEGEFGKPNERQICTPGVKFSPEIPEQLLDIELELRDKIITNINKLNAIITFENFGTDPVTVSLNYIILNEFGEEVYNEFGEIIVYTESVVIKKFDNLKLDLGKYKFILRINYGDNITEEFEQEFEIKESIIGKYAIYGLIGFLVLILLSLIILYILKKRKNKKS